MAEKDAGLHVVVTIAPNGVVHAWGEGPVYDPSGKLVTPFASRSRARQVAARFRREDTEERLTRNPDTDGEVEPLTVKVCKVLGIEPVTVEAQDRPRKD